CRNNGWAISTPVADQFRNDGIVVRGPAYGVPSVRVDGNDARALYSAVHEARKMAISGKAPAFTYRAGHHSTSDDSTRYRQADEIDWWRMEQDPELLQALENGSKEKDGGVPRLSQTFEAGIQAPSRSHATQVADNVEKPPLADIFTDVYSVPPSNL
ncbi:hypothetical protein RJ639_038945, partial [Escallonia herrerae]